MQSDCLFSLEYSTNLGSSPSAGGSMHGDRGSPQGTRGGSQEGRKGNQSGAQQGGRRGQLYVVPIRPKSYSLNVVIAGMILACLL